MSPATEIAVTRTIGMVIAAAVFCGGCAVAINVFVLGAR